jgi:hypothetical protein
VGVAGRDALKGEFLMAATDRIHGYKGDVKADKTGGATAVSLASINAWSASFATQKTNVTCFNDPNLVYVQGLPDIKGSLAGYWDKTDRTVFEVAFGFVAAMLELYPSSLDPTYYWNGLAWLDAAIDVKVDGAVTIKSDFVAAGPWEMLPAPVLLARAA